jgi:hypothetical protein
LSEARHCEDGSGQRTGELDSDDTPLGFVAGAIGWVRCVGPGMASGALEVSVGKTGRTAAKMRMVAVMMVNVRTLFVFVRQEKSAVDI